MAKLFDGNLANRVPVNPDSSFEKVTRKKACKLPVDNSNLSDQGSCEPIPYIRKGAQGAG